MRVKSKNEKKKLGLLICMLLTLAFGLGYAVLSEQLKLNGTINYGTMAWDVGFTTAEDGGGSISSSPTVSEDKKSISITCNVGISTSSETCIAKAKVKNASTFAVKLESNPTITYDGTYISSVTSVWSENSANIVAGDSLNANIEKEIKVTITTKELTSDMLPESNLSFPVNITLDWIELENKNDDNENVSLAQWSLGSIFGTPTSTTFGTTDTSPKTRITNTNYIKISAVKSIYLNDGWELVWYAYDADKKPLGNKTSITGVSGSGANWEKASPFNTSTITDRFSNAVYFRLVIRNTLDETLVVDEAIENSGITFTLSDNFVAENYVTDYLSTINYQKVATLNETQGGTSYGNYLFQFTHLGVVTVFDTSSYQQVSQFTLPKLDLISPHSNAVFFGNEKFDENDEFPLLYTNVYNNYDGDTDERMGELAVYRLTRSDNTFTASLVQVIKIGFVNDTNYWAQEGVTLSSTNSFGNFILDYDNNKLYTVVIRNKIGTRTNKDDTVFFKFNMPKLSEGEFSETYGCHVVTLLTTDIEDRWVDEWFGYIQDIEYKDGYIISIEGIPTYSYSTPRLRIIDLSQKRIVREYNLKAAGLTEEPELLTYNGNTLYMATVHGPLYKLTIDLS